MQSEFAELCTKLLETKSYKQKEALLKAYQGDSAIRDLFQYAVDPNLRSLTKPIATGVGPATVNKVWPNLIQPLRIMLYDKIRFDVGESWLTLIHHLEDYKNWVVSPDPLGIRCLVEVKNGKAIPRSDRINRLLNFEEIGKEILEQFGETNIILDGRLSSEIRVTRQDVYDAYEDPENGDKDYLCYYCFDIVDTTAPFEQRYEFIRNREDTQRLKFVKCEPIDYTSRKQLTRFSNEGYFAVLLRYTKAVYESGLSRNLLSLTI